jgi:hypothetical protein
MKLTGKDGVLRIFDSSLNLHGASPRADGTVDIVKWDGAAVWTNITSDVEADDANFESAFLTDNDDAVFVGSDKSFAMIDYLKDAGANYAAASGALLAYYFDGSDFSNAVTVSDGTASGGNCFAQDGQISFSPPEGWALGANIVNAGLDADKYYIKLMTTDSPSTDPDADVLCPVDAQFFEVIFANMDFTGPIGRPRQEEILALNRGKADSNMHYIKGPDSPLYEPLPISFSLALDDTVNKNDIQPALACGNPGSTYWTATGTTAKGTTKNDGTNNNPAFADSNKKAVNIQILFGTMGYGWAYYEVYSPEDQITFAESESDVILSVAGGCFGLIEMIYGFGVRY